MCGDREEGEKDIGKIMAMWVFLSFPKGYNQPPKAEILRLAAKVLGSDRTKFKSTAKSVSLFIK